MQFSALAILSFAASIVPPISASLRGLQGNSGGNGKGNGNGNGNGNGLPINECTINAISYLQIPGEVPIAGGDEHFGCDDGSGSFLSLKLDDSQARSLKNLAANGKLKFGRSKIDVGGAVVGNDNTVTLPPGQAISVIARNNKGNPFDRDRRELQAGTGTGDKHFLLFRVTDVNGLVVEDNADVMSDNLFGTGTDSINLKSQMTACSNGKYTVIPGGKGNYDTSGLESATGVIDIEIGISLLDATQNVENAIVAAAKVKLGTFFGEPLTTSLATYADHTLFSLENCYHPANDCGWAAYAYVGGSLQVYKGAYYSHAAVQLHEHGHNMELAHSGGLNGATYTDWTCAMGNPLFADDLGQMCFNPAKNWQMQFNPHPTNVISGWYDSADFIEVNPAAGAQTFKMIGVGEYNLQSDGVSSNRKAVALKILTGTTTSQYVAFNSAKGANAQNVEADNQVTIVEYTGSGYSVSALKGYVTQGNSFTTTQGRVVTAQCINTAVTPSLACVCVRENTSQTCPPCVCGDTPVQPTPPPTPCPQTEFIVDILTDNYPAETTWELINNCDGSAIPVASGGPYANQATLYSSETYCLPDVEYMFAISDSFGDGICCSYGVGSYSVKKDGVEVIGGGEFASSDSKVFGSCAPQPPTNAPTPNPTNEPTPNPTPNPTPVPTPSPTNEPTPNPTPNPTPVPTPSPTNEPTPNPTPNPTPVPTPSPTNEPTPNPTPNPTPVPTPSTPSPTNEPTPNPTPNPTPVPTPSTPSPTNEPTPNPTPNPTPVSTPSLPVVAEFDPSLQVPKCSAVGPSCTSGSLLDGKASNIEPNPPNTLDSCVDGTGGYHADESIDSITVSAVGGGQLEAGGLAEIEATVWPYGDGSSNVADFYYTTTVDNAPTWTHINSLSATGNGSGLRTLKLEYQLPNTPIQAVRVNFRYFGVQSSCSGGTYDDVDDLVFAVVPAAAGTMEIRTPKPVPTLKPLKSSHCTMIDERKRCKEVSICEWQNGKDKGCYPKN